MPAITAIVLVLFSLYSGAFSAVKEKVESSCYSDPTFGGKCYLKQVKSDGASCKNIGGVNICRDWWTKEYVYECDGADDALLQRLSGQHYCRSVSKCEEWQEINSKDGVVSCRVYFDKNRPGCDSNPFRTECIADDCVDLKNRCRLLEYIKFGDIVDKANSEVRKVCDYRGEEYGCYYENTAGSVSGVDTGTYVYQCPSSVRKVCKKYSNRVICPAKCPDGKMIDCDDNGDGVCPDGSKVKCSSQSCEEREVCKESRDVQVSTTETRSCQVNRKYVEYDVVSGSSDDDFLKSNPKCVKVRSYRYPDCSGTVVDKGGVKICQLYQYNGVVSGIDSRHIERNRSIPAGASVGAYIGVVYSCDNDRTLIDIIVKRNGQKIGEKHTACNVAGQYHEIYRDSSGGNIDYLVRVAHGSGTSWGNHIYDFSDSDKSSVSDWDAGGNHDRVELNFGYLIEEKNIYRCYIDAIESCGSNFSECRSLDNTHDLSSLSCVQTAISVTGKPVCVRYALQYECPARKTVSECTRKERVNVCSSGVFPVRDVPYETKDHSGKFGEAAAKAQMVNELKHIWSGKWMRCDSGWFSSVFEDPFKYFVQKAVGYVIATYGAKFALAAEKFFGEYAANCLGGYVGNDTSGLSGCLQREAQNAWTDAGATMDAWGQQVQDMFNQFGGIGSIITSPAFQFALSVAIDIISNSEQCNACTEQKCATKYGFYDTYGLIKGDSCIHVSSGCAWKAPFGCLRRKYHYCCYDSVFAKIVVKNAYKQLGYSFDNGNCSALTFDDIKRLDFSKMDWSELNAYIETKMKGMVDPNDIKSKVEKHFDRDYGVPRFNGESPFNN